MSAGDQRPRSTKTPVINPSLQRKSFMSDLITKAPLLSRRNILGAAGALAAAGPVSALSSKLSFAQTASTAPIKVGWTGTGICLISIPVAYEKGFWKKHGANVELINYGSNFAAGVESVASGKLDVFVNFILQYLK